MKKNEKNFWRARANAFAAIVTFAYLTIGIACNSPQSPTAPTPANGGFAITSAAVSTPPVVDGDPNDAAWNAAPWTTIRMRGFSGVSNEFDANIKSVHTAADVYFLVEYPDPDEDDAPDQLVYNGGATSDPKDWANSGAGQDGFSFMWDMMLSGKSARDPGGKFSDSTYGCTAACHTSRSLQNLESGMFPDTGEVDIWFWNAGTTNPQGYADDEYAVGADSNGTADNVRRNKDGGEEKQFADANFSIGAPSFPDNIAGGGNGNLDPKKFLWSNSSVQFDSTRNPATGAPWKALDGVPGWALSAPNLLTGEADVRAKGVWSGGVWTIEFQRALLTDHSENDVEFNAQNSYTFSIAVHENAKKYTDWQYASLGSAPMPPHYGCVPRAITLRFQ